MIICFMHAIHAHVGIGWTSWKKRWFILTRTSLVFFRSDPVSESLYSVGLTFKLLFLYNLRLANFEVAVV